MSRYKAYPEYKDSGVEWLGLVPQHWNARQLKFLCTCNDEVLGESIHPEYEIEYIDIGSVSASEGISKTETMMFSVAPSRARRIVRDGDVIVSTVRTYLEAIASIDNPPPNLIVSTGFAVIRPNRYLHKKFAAYCLRTSGFIKEVIARSVGVSYPAINASDLINIKAPLPQFSEQQKIANFLDHETAKIDTLIAKQQELIKLLKEKRQAVISHAVTKGLNPNAPMRDSGIEWLGEVPAHWSIRKFNHCASIRNGQVDPTVLPYRSYILIAPNHIESGTGRLLELETAEAQAADSGKYLCMAGEIIYSKIRPALAKVCVSPTNETICSADMYPIRAENGLSNDFLFFSLLSNWFTSFAILESDRVAMPKINREKLSEIKIAFPGVEEQSVICGEIRRQISIVDKLLEESERSILLAYERRTALISAAVTGKIDVRDWQPPASEAQAA